MFWTNTSDLLVLHEAVATALGRVTPTAIAQWTRALHAVGSSVLGPFSENNESQANVPNDKTPSTST